MHFVKAQPIEGQLVAGENLARGHNASDLEGEPNAEGVDKEAAVDL
jgi:hypothetical protein